MAFRCRRPLVLDDGAGVVRRRRSVVCAVYGDGDVLRRFASVSVADGDGEDLVVVFALGEFLNVVPAVAVRAVVQSVCVCAVGVDRDTAVCAGYGGSDF